MLFVSTKEREREREREILEEFFMNCLAKIRNYLTWICCKLKGNVFVSSANYIFRTGTGWKAFFQFFSGPPWSIWLSRKNKQNHSYQWIFPCKNFRGGPSRYWYANFASLILTVWWVKPSHKSESCPKVFQLHYFQRKYHHGQNYYKKTLYKENVLAQLIL